MPRTNEEVARLLHELAVLSELDEANPNAFRVRAYENAARAVSGLGRDIADLTAAELRSIKGIGPAIAAKIEEHVATGRISKLEQLRERYHPGMRELLRVPGLGAKTVRLLHEVLGVDDLAGLRAALDDGRVRELPGMGERREANLAEALERLVADGHHARTPIAKARPVADRLVDALRGLPGVQGAWYAGSLRRFRETIGDLDLLVVTDEPGAVTAAFTGLGEVREVLATGPTKTSVRTWDGLQVDLRVVTGEQEGAALLYFTGSKAHNIRLRQRAIARGWTLNEYALSDATSGAIVASATEEDIYAALDLAWIAPQLREDTGEIEASDAGELPDLVELSDLRGDLHDHTDLSGDGRVTLADLVAEAEGRGLAYLAITDHAEDLRINGVSRTGMLAQRAQLRALQEHHEIHLLHGAELNIGRDGGLDYDDAFLAGFDWCVASVHSHFRLPVEEQTERVLAAIRHPAVNVIGHLVGRRIGRRPGIDLDIDRVLDAARETGTAIEVNANLDRLDASAEVIREGVARGVTFTISTDAHARHELDYAAYGVEQGRRGWLTPERTANTWPLDRFLDWAASVRRGT